MAPNTKAVADVASTVATLGDAPSPNSSSLSAATLPSQRASASAPPPQQRNVPAPAQSAPAWGRTDPAPIARHFDSGRKEKLDAMLVTAARERWQIFRNRDTYEFNESWVDNWPEGHSLVNDPAHADYIKKAMAALYQQQQKEFERIIEALDESQCIKFDDRGFVLEESVHGEVRPLLTPRRWWHAITHVAKQRADALSKTSARNAEAAARAKDAGRPLLPAATHTAPIAAAPERGAVAASTTQLGTAPANVLKPSSQSRDFAPAEGASEGSKASNPAVIAVSSIPDEVAAPAASCAPPVSKFMPAPAAPPEAPVAPPMNEGTIQKRNPSIAEVSGTVESVPPRAGYEKILADIEKFDFPIIRDGGSNEFRLDSPPLQWLPILFAPGYAAETRRRVNGMGVARTEIPKVVASITGTGDKPSQIRFQGEEADFRALGAEERALYEKYRTSEKVLDALEVARELYAEAEAYREAQLAKHFHDRQRGRG
jgi:hypothetical protein